MIFFCSIAPKEPIKNRFEQIWICRSELKVRVPLIRFLRQKKTVFFGDFRTFPENCTGNSVRRVLFVFPYFLAWSSRVMSRCRSVVGRIDHFLLTYLLFKPSLPYDYPPTPPNLASRPIRGLQPFRTRNFSDSAENTIWWATRPAIASPLPHI